MFPLITKAKQMWLREEQNGDKRGANRKIVCLRSDAGKRQRVRLSPNYKADIVLRLFSISNTIKAGLVTCSHNTST